MGSMLRWLLTWSDCIQMVTKKGKQATIVTMAEEPVKSCSNPGCDQPGTSSCSACKTTTYCCVNCQTADWPRHKEECHGHLRKLALTNLEKAAGFYRVNNYQQSLRYADITLQKLTKLCPKQGVRPAREIIELNSDALAIRYDALNFMSKDAEALECAKKRYTLWATYEIRSTKMLVAGIALIESLVNNKEYAEAEMIARTAFEMINDKNDDFIPTKERQQFIAEGSKWLGDTIYRLAENGGIAPNEMQKAKEEAIMLARQALEIYTRMDRTSERVAESMTALADILGYFNDVDDDEVTRLYEQANVLFARHQGSSSYNVANGKFNLGIMYGKRANRAVDSDRCKRNRELALTHYRESNRIYKAINHVAMVERTAQLIMKYEFYLSQPSC